MQSMSFRFFRRVSFIASGAPRCWSPSTLARRAPLNPAASALPGKRLSPFSRFTYGPLGFYHGTGLRSEKRQDKMDWTTEGLDAEMREATDCCLWHASPFNNSSHRDGAIYKRDWSDYLMDMNDRNETVSELEKTSKGPCYPDEENCAEHSPAPMLQIFSLKLAKTPVNSGSIQLYGYMAARNDMDGLLNYVFNRSRDNPVVIQQGSLMEMSGPKRGILLLSDVLMEFDMRIKTGEKEEDDLQLIDGVEQLTQRIPTRPFVLRFNGSCGAVDMCLTFVEAAMEARIEVVICEVKTEFNLSLSSFVSVTKELTEFQIFHGTIGGLVTKTFVVAFPAYTIMHLKFKAGAKGSVDAAHYCSFNSKQHGCVIRQIKLDMATILVKVNVSPPWL